MRISFLTIALFSMACGTSNADFATANAAVSERLEAQLRAIKTAVEAASPSSCSTAPALSWTYGGEHNVEFLPYERLDDIVADAPTHLQAVTYAEVLSVVPAWLNPKSPSYLGKRPGSVQPLVKTLTQGAATLEFLVVTRMGAFDTTTGKLEATSYLTSLRDASVICSVDFIAGADPKGGTESYVHVEQGTGRVVNEHRVGVSDRLAAAVGQNFTVAMKDAFGVRLTR